MSRCGGFYRRSYRAYMLAASLELGELLKDQIEAYLKSVMVGGGRRAAAPRGSV